MFYRLAFIFALLFITKPMCPGVPVASVYNFNYQALLTDTDGEPLSGNHVLFFNIYEGGTSTSGGTLVYAENSEVTVNEGVVNYSLGNIAPTTGFLSPQLFNFTSRFYLEVAVDVDTNVIVPRTEIQSVPKALKAETATTASLAINATFAPTAQAAPWSGLTGTPSDLADGIPVGNVVPVAKTGTQFSTIQSAINSITDASLGNQYLVHIAPGEYVEAVVMKPYVHLEGSGQENTTISFVNDGANSSAAAFRAAGNCEVRDLTVYATTAGYWNQAIMFISTPGLRFRNVTSKTSGGNYALAFYGGSSSSVELIDCTAICELAADLGEIVSLSGQSSVKIDRLQVIGNNANSRGLFISNCPNAVVRNSTVRVSGGTNLTAALQSLFSNISCYNNEFTATGNSVSGLLTQNSTVNLTNCEVTGSTAQSATLDLSSNTRFVGCKISGGNMFLNIGATATCTNCLDEAGVPSTFPTCP